MKPYLERSSIARLLKAELRWPQASGNRPGSIRPGRPGAAPSALPLSTGPAPAGPTSPVSNGPP